MQKGWGADITLVFCPSPAGPRSLPSLRLGGGPSAGERPGGWSCRPCPSQLCDLRGCGTQHGAHAPTLHAMEIGTLTLKERPSCHACSFPAAV